MYFFYKLQALICNLKYTLFRDSARGGALPPTITDRTVKNQPKADFWTVKTGRKAGFYRPINSQTFQFEVMQFTVQKWLFMEQNGKIFRAFGAINLPVWLLR